MLGRQEKMKPPILRSLNAVVFADNFTDDASEYEHFPIYRVPIELLGTPVVDSEECVSYYMKQSVLAPGFIAKCDDNEVWCLDGNHRLEAVRRRHQKYFLAHVAMKGK